MLMIRDRLMFADYTTGNKTCVLRILSIELYYDDLRHAFDVYTRL